MSRVPGHRVQSLDNEIGKIQVLLMVGLLWQVELAERASCLDGAQVGRRRHLEKAKAHTQKKEFPSWCSRNESN